MNQKKDVNIEMDEKMNPKDFQNNFYACCGLMELKKWGVECHTMQSYNNGGS